MTNNSAALVELTQGALAKLRSSEFNMRIVQLQSSTSAASSSSAASPSVVSMSDIDMSSSMWKHKWGGAGEGNAASFSVMLPVILIDYYKALQSDGLHFAASVSRSSSVTGSGSGSGDTSSVAAMSYVCSCRFHRLCEIVPVQLGNVEMMSVQHPAGGGGDTTQAQQQSARGAGGVAASWAGGARPAALSSGGGNTVASAAMDEVGLGNTLYSPRPAVTRVRCFLLSPGAVESTTINGVDGPRSPMCDVILVFREKPQSSCGSAAATPSSSSSLNNNPEVWGRNTVTGRLFYLCRTVEDYIRLGCRMFWVSGWQLCFDVEQGPPEWSMPWMRMLCPGPLAQALSIAK
jgi:hypothetical protein